MNHSPYPHLVELGWAAHNNLAAVDAPRAQLHIEKCPCGADTVRPWEPGLVDLMRAEWGVRCTVDERVRERVLSLTYDPTEREDLASGNVWPVLV